MHHGVEKRGKLRKLRPESVGRRKVISFTMCKISNSLDPSLGLNGWNQVERTKVFQRGNWSSIPQLCQKLNKVIKIPAEKEVPKGKTSVLRNNA